MTRSTNGSAPQGGAGSTLTERVRVAIVGAGFSGIGAAHRLLESGERDFVVLERAPDVGGVWWQNTYPGCQCDVPSHLYSFSFAPNPSWSRTFSRHREIQAYLSRCADELGVRPHLRLGCEVTGARWDPDELVWRLETSGGELSAEILVAGVGPLTEPAFPEIPGLETFEGTSFHSADWDHGHDLTGERVAVIGTGASAIQFVPEIQPEVAAMHVFQRTPPWVMPHSDRPLAAFEKRLYRRVPALQRLVRNLIYWSREALVLGFAKRRGLMKVPERISRVHLKRQVSDPELRAKLTPDYEIGCKRILISNEYWRSLERENVELVSDAIVEVRPHSVVTADGTEREVDTIIYGTGFRVTDPPAAEHIRAGDGRTLADAWANGLEAYRGTNIAGFPNLFFLTGPNTGLGHTSMVVMIEAQLQYMSRALAAMRASGVDAIDVRPEVQAAENEEIARRMKGTVWEAGGCQSWYKDANGRITTIWPDFTFRFRERLHRFELADYETLKRAPERAPIAA